MSGCQSKSGARIANQTGYIEDECDVVSEFQRRASSRGPYRGVFCCFEDERPI